MTSTIKQWENAEKERSAAEAAHLDESSLRVNFSSISRYRNPSVRTVHPLEYAIHLMGDVSGKTVLEYGCGDGINTVLLANRGAKVIALDLSPDLIDIAHKRLVQNNLEQGVEFIVGSAHDIPLTSQTVDVVFGIAILHHLDLTLSASEVRRVLKQGGSAIFQEPIRNSKIMRSIRGLIPYKSPDVSPYERPLTDKEMKDFAQGYSEFHSRPFSLPWSTVVYHLLPFFRRYTTIPSLKFDSAILRAFPTLGYFSPVHVVRMTK